jgi:hypothetical protein
MNYRKLIYKVVLFMLCTTLWLSIPQISLADEAGGSREGGKNQTPVQVIVQIVVTTILLKWLEPRVLP